MQHRIEIESLRGVAVLAVVFYHAGFHFLDGGYLGVDIFFVISGYLLTQISLNKYRFKFNFLDFYERRARRTIPALVFVLTISYFYGWLILGPNEMEQFSKSLVMAILQVSNIYFYALSGYFDTSSQIKPLIHTWSLSLEWQYYLLFPFIFVNLSANKYKKFCVCFIVLSIILFSLLFSNERENFNFFLLPGRIWEFVSGMGVAFVLLYKNKITRLKIINEIASFIGLLLISLHLLNIFNVNSTFNMFNLIFGTSLVIIFCDKSTFVGKFLNFKPLVFTGSVSYSLYLWHQPLFALARLSTSSGLLNTYEYFFLIIFAYFLAIFTFYYVEQPSRKLQITSKNILRRYVLIYIFLIILGVVGANTKGFFDIYEKQNILSFKLTPYLLVKRHANHDINKSMINNNQCIFWTENIENFELKRYENCVLRHGKSIIIFGDSHGQNIYNAFAKSESRDFVVGFSRGGCRLSNNSDYCHFGSLKKFIEKNKSTIDFVLYFQSGAYLMSEPDGTVYNSSDNRDNIQLFKLDLFQIRPAVDYLQELSKSVKVIWLGPYIQARTSFNRPEPFSKGGFTYNENAFYLFSNLNIWLDEYFKSHQPSFKYINFSNLNEVKINSLVIDDCLTFRDHDHLSLCGEDILARQILLKLVLF